MLVSKNPYVTEPRQNLSPKKPHFTLKTGENLTQNLRLKTLIFITKKYGTKLLSNFLRKNIAPCNKNAFAFSATTQQHHYLVLLLTPTLSRERILLLAKADTLLAGF